MVFQIWCILLGLGVAARPGQVNVLHYVTGEARALVSLQKGESFLQEGQVSDAVGKASTMATMKVGQRFRVETDVAGWELATLRRIHPTYLLQFDDGETMEVDQPTKVPVRPERRRLSASLVESSRTGDPPSPPEGSTPTAEELINKEIQAQKNLEDLPKDSKSETQEKDEENGLPKDEHVGATDMSSGATNEFPADLPDPEATETDDEKELSNEATETEDDKEQSRPPVTSMDGKSPVSNEATETDDDKELTASPPVTSMDGKSPVSNEATETDDKELTASPPVTSMDGKFPVSNEATETEDNEEVENPTASSEHGKHGTDEDNQAPEEADAKTGGNVDKDGEDTKTPERADVETGENAANSDEANHGVDGNESTDETADNGDEKPFKITYPAQTPKGPESPRTKFRNAVHHYCKNTSSRINSHQENVRERLCELLRELASLTKVKGAKGSSSGTQWVAYENGEPEYADQEPEDNGLIKEPTVGTDQEIDEAIAKAQEAAWNKSDLPELLPDPDDPGTYQGKAPGPEVLKLKNPLLWPFSKEVDRAGYPQPKPKVHPWPRPSQVLKEKRPETRVEKLLEDAEAEAEEAAQTADTAVDDKGEGTLSSRWRFLEQEKRNALQELLDKVKMDLKEVEKDKHFESHEVVHHVRGELPQLEKEVQAWAQQGSLLQRFHSFAARWSGGDR